MSEQMNATASERAAVSADVSVMPAQVAGSNGCPTICSTLPR